MPEIVQNYTNKTYQLCAVVYVPDIIFVLVLSHMPEIGQKLRMQTVRIIYFLLVCRILFTSLFLEYARIRSNVYAPDQLQFMFLICFNRWCVCMDHEDFEKLCAIAFRIVAATHKENCSCQCSFCDICHTHVSSSNGTSALSRCNPLDFLLYLQKSNPLDFLLV
jgi:hypothetical protein